MRRIVWAGALAGVMAIGAALPAAGQELLAVGEMAPDFELPRADGSLVRLSALPEEHGARFVIVSTYRAFW